jgi:hypothetical protein
MILSLHNLFQKARQDIMKKLLSIPLCILLILMIHGIAAAQPPSGGQSSRIAAPAASGLSPEQASWVARADRHEKAGWIYLHIEGAPRVRGFQYGFLAAEEIRESLRVRKVVWTYQTGADWEWLVKKSAKMFTPKVDRENREEIDGIVEGLAAVGVRTTRDEMVAYNGYFDLIGYWWPKEKKRINADPVKPPLQSCSSFIAAGSMTADGGVVLGHNTMLGYPEADANIILDILPEHGHRILMQAIPGWIHSGTDFFITDAGLVGSETTIGGFNSFDAKAVPEFVRMRRATQDASSIEEWCAIVKKGNNGGYANAWLLGDVNTGEIARLELGLKYVAFEKKRDGFFIGSNVAEDLKILRFETDTAETDVRNSSVARRVRWKQLMKEFSGTVTIETAKSFEADHFDPYLGREFAGGRSLCSHADQDPQSSGKGTPFSPSGTFDAKVVDTAMAKRMSFAARWGSACGAAFDAVRFLSEHPQFDWMSGLLKSRPSEPWVEFRAGEKE